MVSRAPMTRFISCDWGTSRLRLRLVEPAHPRTLVEHATDEGIQPLARQHPDAQGRAEFLAGVLERAIVTLGAGVAPDLPVVISGMASSTLGWMSLPYARLPAPVDGSTIRFVDFQSRGRPVRLVSGLQDDSDVMRGEETELIGLFADPAILALADNCTVVLPGSHSKHVRVRAGRIVNFSTFLTGELYALLAQHSTLSTPGETAFDDEAFLAGVRASRTLGLSAALFQTRARTVLGHLPARHSRAFLSGVLIGGEVAAFAGTPELKIVLAATETVARPYALALTVLAPGAEVVPVAAADLALAAVIGQTRILALSAVAPGRLNQFPQTG